MTKIRLLHCAVAAACLVMTSFLAMPQAFAQGREMMNIGDQPGYVPNEAEEELPPEYKRTAVFYRTTEAPGTIVISTSERYLYLVQGNGRALRYGIGVGREGFQWQGLQKISRKQEWPDWTPPPEMIAASAHICLASWRAAPAIRWARARFISAPRSTAFTAPTSRRPSAAPYRPAASGWSMPTWPTSIDRVPVGTKVIIRQRPEL